MRRVRVIDHDASAITIIDAIDDAKLFAPWFSKQRESWDAWRAFLSALFALPMDAEQLALYQRCTGRKAAPKKVAHTGILVAGRRAGKSITLALISVWLAGFHDYRKFLAPGERGTVMIIASDRKQARIILRYVGALLREVPLLQKMIERETAEGFDLSNRVTIEVGTSSFRSVRGYTIVAALLDEAAFWSSDDNSANPDHEVVKAIKPAMATIPNAMLLVASSPYARRGILWDAYRQHYGKDGDPTLVWQAATRVMNPNIPQSVIDAEYEKDPASASAEYGAQFRADIEQFVSLDAVMACVAKGLSERPPILGVKYHAFVDPSGGSADSMTLAIAHRERSGVAVLDVVREVKPKFSPDEVVRDFSTLLKAYGIKTIIGDRYAGIWPVERFKAHGIDYEQSAKPKSEIYAAALPLLNSKTVELLDDPRLVSQFVGLERRTTRGSGRDVIDHQPGSHDDVVNAVCGAITTLSERKYKYDVSLAWVSGDSMSEEAKRTFQASQYLSKQQPQIWTGASAKKWRL